MLERSIFQIEKDDFGRECAFKNICIYRKEGIYVPEICIDNYDLCEEHEMLLTVREYHDMRMGRG